MSMTQSELEQFRELLVKAQATIPPADRFEVSETPQGLVLQGKAFDINNGWVIEYQSTETFYKKVSEDVIY